MPRRRTTAGRSASSAWSSGSRSSVILSMGPECKTPPWGGGSRGGEGSTALARTLARVLLAAGVGTALEADLLAAAGGERDALGGGGTGGGLAVRFGDDLVAHDGSV